MAKRKKIPKSKQAAVSSKISKLVGEGVPRKQAIAQGINTVMRRKSY